MAIERGRLTPDLSVEPILGGVHFRQTPPLDHIPDLQPFRYVAVGLTELGQLDPEEFDATTREIVETVGNDNLKFVVVVQIDKGLSTVGDALLVFPTRILHANATGHLSAARFLTRGQRSAGYVTRTEGDRVVYDIHGNSESLPIRYAVSDLYRDEILIPGLKKAGVHTNM